MLVTQYFSLKSSFPIAMNGITVNVFQHPPAPAKTPSKIEK